MATNKGKNIGEWSEMYIFFKLMSDRKVYVADKDFSVSAVFRVRQAEGLFRSARQRVF